MRIPDPTCLEECTIGFYPIRIGTEDLQENMIILHLVSIVAESSVYPLHLVVPDGREGERVPPHPPTISEGIVIVKILCVLALRGLPPLQQDRFI